MSCPQPPRPWPPHILPPCHSFSCSKSNPPARPTYSPSFISLPHPPHHAHSAVRPLHIPARRAPRSMCTSPVAHLFCHALACLTPRQPRKWPDRPWPHYPVLQHPLPPCCTLNQLRRSPRPARTSSRTASQPVVHSARRVLGRHIIGRRSISYPVLTS